MLGKWSQRGRLKEAERSKITKKRYLTILFFRTLGNSLVVTAVFWLVYAFYPVLKVEFFYQLDKARGVQREVAIGEALPEPPKSSFGEILRKPKPLTITPVSREFGIVIPKINANGQIIPNVDPRDYQEYSKKLLEGIAHARGSVFPGEIGNCYLFAHSVGHLWEIPRYNAQFYLLHNLQEGDLIHLFYRGRQYDYKVVEKIVVSPSDTSYLNILSHEPILTLQTCYPPGTTWRRLIVIAKLIAGS